VGVRAPHRRKGLGRALLEQSRAALMRRVGSGCETRISHWDPGPTSEGFARAMGFEHDRYFWEMRRPGRIVPATSWPEAIETHTFDGSPRAFEDWNECSNEAFANNPMSARSTVEQCRMLSEHSSFHPSGLL